MGHFFGQPDHAGSIGCVDGGGSNASSGACFGRLRLPRQGAGARGFTLIELMVALVVAAVLLAVAVPSFKSITVSSKLNTAVNDLVGSLNTARMEAIKANASSQLCSNASSSNGSDTQGAACTAQTVGAVVLATGSTLTVVRAGSPIPAPLIISGSATAIRFSGDGIGHAVGNTDPYTGAVADICTSSTSTDNHRTINMTSGTILETSTSSGACQ